MQMTVGNFLSMLAMGEKSVEVVTIHDHKTGKKDRCFIPLTNKLLVLNLSAWLQELRPRFLESGVDSEAEDLPLFPSTSGKALRTFDQPIEVFKELSRFNEEHRGKKDVPKLSAYAFRTLHATWAQTCGDDEVSYRQFLY